jgi:chitodextrinase
MIPIPSAIRARLLFLALLTVFCFPQIHAQSPYVLSMSSYLGDAGDTEEAVGLRILSDGTIVVAANLGTDTPEQLNDPSITPTLLGNATASTSGVILRLSRDGRSLLSVTRLANSLRDLDIDDADNLYVAAGSDGLFKLNPAANTVLWQHFSGEVIHRVSASPSGWVTALRPSNTDSGSIDTTPGPGLTYLVQPDGSVYDSYSGIRNTLDVTVDEVSSTIIQIGWRQANAWQQDGSGTLPVQIAYMRGLAYDGSIKWSLYDWEVNSNIDGGNEFSESDIIVTNPLFLNSTGQPIGVDDQGRTLYGFLNNMADTRGYRVRMGRDGYLYAAFEAAGGNHIFRYEGSRDTSFVDFRKTVAKAGGDVFHAFINTGAGHKTYIARYLPSTGNYVTGNEFNTVVTTNNSAGANTLRIRTGGIAVDESGQLFFGSDSASGLPFASNIYFNSNNSPDQYSIDAYGLQDVGGGAFIWGMNPNMNQRVLVGRLGPGVTRSVDARILDGETEPLVAFAGRANLNRPMLTRAPLQPQPGYGSQDAFVVVLGGEESVGSSGNFDFNYGGSGVSYTSTGTRLRGVLETRYAADVDGDGLIDDRIAEYAWNPDIALSPPAPNYTGPVFRGGFRSRYLNATSGTYATNSYSGTNTSIRIQQSGILTNQHGVFFFDKSDIQGLSPSDTLTLNEDSLLRITGTGLNGGRWLIRNNDTYYISESSFGGTNTQAFSNAEDNGRWAVFQIDEEMSFNVAQAVFANRRFDNITAVGYIINSPTFTTDRFWMQWSGFNASFALNSISNLSPVAVIQSNYSGLTNLPVSVNFDGSSSFDPDGDVTFMSWTFGNGDATGGPIGSTVYDAAGRYESRLRVWDDALVESDSTIIIEVGSQTPSDTSKLVAAWGGNMVNSSYNFRNSGGATTMLDLSGNSQNDDSITGWAFSTSNPLTSTRGTSWFGGLLNKVIGGTAGFADRGIGNSSPYDNINVRMQPSGAPAALHGVMYLDKSEFFGAAVSQPVTFTTGSKIVMSGISRMENTGTIRWLVRDGDTFYVSQQTISTPSSTWTAPGVSDHGVWAEFDPTANLMDFDQDNAVWESRTFSDLTAFGIHWDRDSFLSSRTWLTFNEFYVEAYTDPLPVLQAAFTSSPSVVLPMQKITFDGSSSEGAVHSWQWQFGDGAFSTTGPVVDYQYVAEGTYTVSLTVTNSSGDSSTTSKQVYIGEQTIPESGYDVWAASRFSTSELEDPTIIGLNATPDNDGITNLFKYALDIPRTGTGGVLPVHTESTGDHLSIRFNMPEDRQDIAYVVEASSDLVSWSSIFDSRNDTPTSMDGTIATVVDPVAYTTANDPRFLRLSVIWIGQ